MIYASRMNKRILYHIAQVIYHFVALLFSVVNTGEKALVKTDEFLSLYMMIFLIFLLTQTLMYDTIIILYGLFRIIKFRGC